MKALTISCKNKDLGCSYEGNVENLEEHQVSCKKCPDCEVKCTTCHDYYKVSDEADHICKEVQDKVDEPLLP